MQRALVLLALALALAGCGGRAPPGLGSATELPGTAGRVVASTGSGSRLLRLYAARGPHGVVCSAATLGGVRPRTLRCPRPGLAPPLEGYAGGGGAGSHRWGGYVGLVDDSVASVAFSYAPGRRLALRPAAGIAGVRVFAGETGDSMNGLDARDRGGGTLLDLPSSPLASPCERRNCTAVGSQPPWREIVPLVPLDGGRAVRIALADPGLARALRDHPAWVREVDGWSACTGRPLGAVVVFQLRDPSTFRATLAHLGQPSAPVAYETGVRRELVVHAHELDVSVDLSSGRVAGVEPDTAAIPYAVVVHDHPAGGPDTTDCWRSGD